MALAACGGASDETTDKELALTATPGDAAARPSFTNVKAQVLSHCGGVPVCHRQAPFAAGLNLTDEMAYANLINISSVIAPGKLRVVPSDYADSLLYQKLTDTQGSDEGSPRPTSERGTWKEPSATQLSLVRRWTAAGATNNQELDSCFRGQIGSMGGERAMARSTTRSGSSRSIGLAT